MVQGQGEQHAQKALWTHMQALFRSEGSWAMEQTAGLSQGKVEHCLIQDKRQLKKAYNFNADPDPAYHFDADPERKI